MFTSDQIKWKVDRKCSSFVPGGWSHRFLMKARQPPALQAITLWQGRSDTEGALSRLLRIVVCERPRFLRKTNFEWIQDGQRALSLIPRGLLITFVTGTIPQTFHAAILFSCLCFYDFPKRTAPKIHKIWHLVNLINVLQPFAKKDENSKKDGWCFPPGSLWDLDGPICRTWMLYAGSVLSFSVTIRIPPPCPSWG